MDHRRSIRFAVAHRSPDEHAIVYSGWPDGCVVDAELGESSQPSRGRRESPIGTPIRLSGDRMEDRLGPSQVVTGRVCRDVGVEASDHRIPAGDLMQGARTHQNRVDHVDDVGAEGIERSSDGPAIGERPASDRVDDRHHNASNLLLNESGHRRPARRSDHQDEMAGVDQIRHGMPEAGDYAVDTGQPGLRDKGDSHTSAADSSTARDCGFRHSLRGQVRLPSGQRQDHPRIDPVPVPLHGLERRFDQGRRRAGAVRDPDAVSPSCAAR